MPRAMTLVVTATEPRTRYMMTTCACTASSGVTPASRRPTIMPGRNTMPTALVVSICGMSAVRRASRRYGSAASEDGWPSARRASISSRLSLNSAVIRRAHEHRRGHGVADHQAGQGHDGGAVDGEDAGTEEDAQRDHGRDRERAHREQPQTRARRARVDARSSRRTRSSPPPTAMTTPAAGRARAWPPGPGPAAQLDRARSAAVTRSRSRRSPAQAETPTATSTSRPDAATPRSSTGPFMRPPRAPPRASRGGRRCARPGPGRG